MLMTTSIKRFMNTDALPTLIFSRFMKLCAQPVLRYAIALFVFSLAVNFACFNWTQAPIIYPDSGGYVKPAGQLKHWQLPDFTLRSPTYPMYLAVAGLVGVIINHSPLQLATYGQIVLGAITIVLIYLLCLKFLITAWLAFSISAFLALNFEVINYQSTILTETFSTALLLAVLYAHIASVGHRLTLWRFVGLIVLDSLLVMLRPNFLFLPMGLYIVQSLIDLAFFRVSPPLLGSSKLFIIVGIAWNLVLVAIWSGLYYLQAGHLGVSRISDINLLGKAIQYGYLDRNYADPPPLARRAQEIYYEEGRPSDPYIVLNKLKKENLSAMGNLRDINAYFMAGQEADFVIKTARLVPEVLNKRSGFYYGRRDGLSESLWLLSITRVFNSLHAWNGSAVIFAFGISLYLLIHKRREQFMALILMLSTVLYHLITITAFAYDEYNRLRVPNDLLLNLLVLLPLILLASCAGRKLKVLCSTAVIFGSRKETA
jgi:hypothetical protein